MIDLDEREVDVLAALVGALMAGAGLAVPDEDLLKDLIDDAIDTPEDMRAGAEAAGFGAGTGAGGALAVARALIETAILGGQADPLADWLGGAAARSKPAAELPALLPATVRTGLARELEAAAAARGRFAAIGRPLSDIVARLRA